MKNWIKHYAWFMKESATFIGKPLLYLIFTAQKKAVKFANGMCKWDALTPKQREAWYLSGEGRTLTIDC